MEEAGTTSFEDHLRCVKWISCSIENKDYILKYLFLDNSYHIMISDFVYVFVETLSNFEIQERCQLVNPGIEVSSERIVQQLKRCIEHLTQMPNSKSIPCNFTVEMQTPTFLVVKCESVMAQMSFLWQFDLDLKQPIFISTHLLHPLIGMVSELKRRNQELLKIIKKKDEEIEDYKTSGARASRRNLETKTFNEEEFLNAMEKSQGMIDCLKNPAKSAFGCNLYNVVSTVHKELSSKPPIKESDGPSNAKMAKSNSKEKISANVLPTEISKSINKQEEIQRRLLLQQQLDLKVKKKTRKKLLKL